MRMEIYRHRKVLLEHLNKFVSAFWRYQPAHVLDCYHVRAQSLHFLCLGQEIFVGEYFLRRFRTSEKRFYLLCECERRILRVYRIAHCAIGHASVLFHVFYSGLYVVHIVKRVEYAHYSQARLYGIAAKTVYYFVRVRSIAEKVAPSGRGA